jgi:hypothetical protein
LLTRNVEEAVPLSLNCLEAIFEGKETIVIPTVFWYPLRRIDSAMEHLPKRTNLATETAATLKEWISAGILKDVLPGELQLKNGSASVGILCVLRWTR